MSELNREQIIKALETIGEVGDCKRDCLFYDGKVHHCALVVARHALSLINELTEENERLRARADRHLENLKAVLATPRKKEANNDRR